MTAKRLLFIPILLLSVLAAQAYTVQVTVTEKKSREPVVMGTVLLQPVGLGGLTDVQGRVSLTGVPNGEYSLQVSYVGFQTRHINLRVNGKDLQMRVELEEASLSLKEVSVTARQNVSGSSTSSIIGRQAIDHLQATSLADIMQLVPGQLMGNHDLTSASNIQLRQLTNNQTSAFGSSVVVDGVPMSNNGAVSLQGTCHCMHYKYMGIRKKPFWYWSEILNSKLNYMSRFWNNEAVLQECDSLGYIPLDVNERKPGWETRNLADAYDPSRPIDQESYDYLWNVYETIARTTQQRGVRLILVMAPVYQTFLDAVSDEALDSIREFVTKLQQLYPNVEFYNFLDAEGFLPEDFNDASHLTSTGADKFSRILKEVIDHPQK